MKMGIQPHAKPRRTRRRHWIFGFKMTTSTSRALHLILRVLIWIASRSRKAAREHSWGRTRGCTQERDRFPGLAPGRGPWWLSPWGLAPISANLTSWYTYPASVLVYFHHLAWSLPVAFCKIFCNEIPAFETFTQRQNRIYCAPEQIKCKRCLPPQIRLGGIFFTDVRATIPLPLEYAGVFLIPERRWGFLILVCAEGIPRGKKNVLARQLQR